MCDGHNFYFFHKVSFYITFTYSCLMYLHKTESRKLLVKKSKSKNGLLLLLLNYKVKLRKLTVYYLLLLFFISLDLHFILSIFSLYTIYIIHDTSILFELIKKYFSINAVLLLKKLAPVCCSLFCQYTLSLYCYKSVDI